MPQFSSEFWIMIITYAIGFAATWGNTTQRLKNLETKVDKHNCLVERMAMAEQSLKSAHHRIDEIKGGR